MRNNLYLGKHGQHNKLTQGSILTNCVAEGCNNTKVWGVVITARCDLAHNGKVKTVHYLPMLDLKDWLVNIGKQELIDIWKKSVKNSINSMMKGWGIDADFLTMGMGSTDLLKICEAKEKKETSKTKFCDFCKAYFDEDNSLFVQFVNHHKDVTTYISNLVGAKSNHYYLLEDWNNENNLKVIVLRDIRRINIDLAKKFSEGFVYSDYSETFLRDNDLHFDSKEGFFDGFYYIENQIQSPFIEHILQLFSANFTRIGVDDMEERFKEVFTNILKNTFV